MDLVPPGLVASRYFKDEQARVDELVAEAEMAIQAIEEYVGEHAVEGGALSEALEEDKITKALAVSRLKQVRRESTPDPDEVTALVELIALYERESETKRAARQAQEDLASAILTKYHELTDAEVKSIVLDDKWAKSICDRVVGEVEALTLRFVGRIQVLGDRYVETVGDLGSTLAALDSKVAGHLAAMGIEP